MQTTISTAQQHLVVTDPGLWDVYLSVGDYQSMEDELGQSPLGRVRLAQLLMYRDRDYEHLGRVAALLAETDPLTAPVRGVYLMMLTRQRRYTEVLAVPYEITGGQPLHLEEAAWAHTAKGTAATELGMLPLAMAHLMTAAEFSLAAGMGRHAEHVRSNALRLQTLVGVADVEALGRHAWREGQQAITRTWNASLLAEGLASYGSYFQAISALSEFSDADAEAQRAFYTVLGLDDPQPLSPEAQATGYGRLSAALVQLRSGRTDYDLLDLKSEPERTYAVLLTAAAELRVPGSGPETAMRLLANEACLLPDQRLISLALQLRAASLGVELVQPRELLARLRDTLDLLEQRGSAHAVLKLLSQMPTTLLLLTMVPNPHPLLRPWIRQIPMLIGSGVQYQNKVFPLAAGETDGWGRHLVCEALEMDPPEKLRRFARNRYEDRITEYKEVPPYLPCAPVNLGTVARTYLQFRRRALDDAQALEANLWTLAYSEVVKLFTDDVQKLLDPHPPMRF